MDYTAVCRLCLGIRTLNPIFGNNFIPEQYSAAILITTGIMVTINDGLPQLICTECVTNINNNLLLRKRSKKSERELTTLQINVQKINITTEQADLDDFSFITVDLLPTAVGDEDSDLDYKDMKVEMLESDDGDNEDGGSCDGDNEDGGSCDGDVDINPEPPDKLDEEDEKPLKYLLDDSDTLEEMDTEKNTDVNPEPPDKQDEEDEKPLKYLLDGRRRLEALDTKKNTAIKSLTKRVTCIVCSKEFAARSLRSHMKRTHPEKTTCEICDVQYDTQKADEHLATCTLRPPAKRKRKRKPNLNDKEKTQCKVCDRVMLRGSLRAHINIAHGGAGKVCEHCGKRFHNQHRLLEHGRARHGHDKLRCPRPQCGFTTAGIMAMKNHERRHLGERPFVCEQCGAAFHARYLLAQHKQSHRPEKTLKCAQCPAVFRTGNALHMHRLAVHSRVRVRCVLCARTFTCRHYAVKHMRLLHKFKGTVPRLELVEGTSEEEEQNEREDKRT